MRPGYVPRLLPNHVAAGDLVELGVTDTENLRIAGRAIVVEIQNSATVDNIQDLDAPTIFRAINVLQRLSRKGRQRCNYSMSLPYGRMKTLRPVLHIR